MQPKITPTTVDKLNGGGNGAFQAVPYAAANVQVTPVVPQDQQPLKVALIGTAPSSRMLAPFNDQSWKIWACSPGNMDVLPRVDVWFEIHANLLWPECASYGPPYIEWLKKQKFPIYMQNQNLVPNALTFPKRELVKRFGRYFFTSSFTWMTALAISQGAKEIALYGIDMASRDEYILQRQAFYHFLWLAEKEGVKISAPHESDIMQPPPLYGYTDATPQGRKMAARRSELKQRIAACDQQINSGMQTKGYLQGAEEDVDYAQAIWGGLADELQLAKEDIIELTTENDRLKQELRLLQEGKPEMALVVAAPEQQAVAS